MPVNKTIRQKALQLNMDEGFYGTFAEIGAGQEVARHFFQAGRASQTVAKTMSAYDMAVSDDIYGREDSGRYVVESRLEKMLSHEMKLLQARLGEKRGENTRFFAFADTVATSKASRKARCHGWMGVEFQCRPQGPLHRLVLHVRMKDAFRLQQQDALGILGVNMIHTAYELASTQMNHEQVILGLVENLAIDRVEIDMLRLSGPTAEQWDNRLLALELVRLGLASATMFNPVGEVVQPSEELFRKSPLVMRGTFRPVTNTNLELARSGAQLMRDRLGVEPITLFEMTQQHLVSDHDDRVDHQDFLDRVETLKLLDGYMLVSNFRLFHQLKDFLRQQTNECMAMVVGASLLEKIIDPQYYDELEGGLLEGMGRLFDAKTHLLVFPYKTEQTCMTASTFHPPKTVQHLYQHLLANGHIQDITNCNDIDSSVISEDIRASLLSGTDFWEGHVPSSVRDLIKSKHLFGWKG